MSPLSHSDSVQQYYDRNTRRFLALGHGGEEMAIHRAVWGPGVTNRHEAMEYCNSLILADLREIAAERVVDLGCGVGGSILYLAEREACAYLGVTLSPVQADLARRLFEDRRLEGAEVSVADFSSPEFWDPYSSAIDLAFSIEATVHVSDLEGVLTGAGRAIRAGGRLLIVDDMLEETPTLGPREQRWLREFKEGWRAPGLRTVSQLEERCAAAGFRLTRNEDLTRYVELDRPRDLLARAFIALFRWWPARGAWFSNLYGGNALQLLLKKRVITYRYLLFERSVT